MNISRFWKFPQTSTAPFCPTDVRETVPVPLHASLWTRFRRYAGIGFLISVGYMDPGNWATDIEGGSRFGYALLIVVILSSLTAMLLQTLCVRLGMATGRDLAQLCRERFSRPVTLALWMLAQIAIIACDFAEVLGTALALKLLFGLSLPIGIALTSIDTLIVLAVQGWGIMRIETIVMILVALIATAFGVEIVLTHPNWMQVARGLVPAREALHDNQFWLIAVGIIGATIMPHNLYLHSSAVSSRKLAPGIASKRDAVRLLTGDTIITLTVACLVNVAILIVAAGAFHFSGHTSVAGIDDAYYLLSPLLGTSAAGIVFALGLLVAGQSSTLTGTMAGQIVLQGFLNIRITCWQQRLLTRLSALVPAWIIIVIMGDASLNKMLIISQVVLSLQLPFAMVPLLMFSANRKLMGEWKLSKTMQITSWVICTAIIAANIYLIVAMS